MKKHTYGLLTVLLFAAIFLPAISSAQILFEKSYPAPYDRTTRDVWPTSDGGFLLVGSSNNADAGDCELYVMKTNAMGEFQWDKFFGGSKPDYAYSMVETHDGNYMIAGFTQSFGGGDYDMYLLKISPWGERIKEVDIGDGKNQEAREIIRTKDNMYVVVGTHGYESTTIDQQIMVVTLDVDLNQVGSPWYYGDAGKQYGLGIKQTPDGGYIICGQNFSNTNGEGDAYLLKIKADGTKEWDKNYGGAHNDEAVGIVANADGSYVWAMRDSSNANMDVDIKIYKVDNAGAQTWTMAYGGASKDTPKTIHALSANEYIVGTISRSFNSSDTPDMWLIKIRDDGATGTEVWKRFFGDPIGHDHCHRAKGVSDGIVACGHTRNPNQKVYFLKLSFDGNLTVGLNDNELLSEETLIFPNPAVGGLVNVRSESLKTGVEVFNILGERIFAASVNSGSDEKIDLSAQPSGVYVINVSTIKGTVSKKIVLR